MEGRRKRIRARTTVVYHLPSTQDVEKKRKVWCETTAREKIETALGVTKPHCDTHQVYSGEQTSAQPHDYDYEKRAISARGPPTVKTARGSYLRPWRDGGTSRLSGGSVDGPCVPSWASGKRQREWKIIFSQGGGTIDGGSTPGARRA